MVKGAHTINFIISPFSASFDIPYRIDKDFTLRKAKPSGKELGKVLSYLKMINAFHGPTRSFEVYELFEKGENVLAVARGKEEIESTESFPHFIAPESGIIWLEPNTNWVKFIDTEWEHWIITSRSKVEWQDIKNLCDAFTISDSGLIIGLRCDEYGGFDVQINSNEPYKEYPLKLYYENNVLKFRDYQKELILTKGDIEQVKEIYHLLKAFNREKYGFIEKAIEEYKNLLTISRSSSLLLVGLFSLLELLLTHDDRNLNASRISWQLQKKIVLLNNQFEERIDFAKHFNCSKDTKEETIIERLYQKRSLVAHGNQGDYSRDLQIISKGDEIFFLRLLIRKTISYALKYPQLISDLREC